MGDLLVPAGLFILFAFFGGGDDKPTDPNKPTDPTKPNGPDPKKPGRYDPPKTKPDLPSILDPYPTSGGAYQIVQGDKLLGNANQNGIAHRAIAQDVYVYAKAQGFSDADALNLASGLAAKHRSKYVSEIQGDKWNDRQYGTYGYGQQAVPSSLTGRALRLYPYHANNRERMLQGEPPIRSILLSTPSNKKQGTGVKAPGAPGGNLELIVLPKYDVAKLVNDDVMIVDRNWHPQWLLDLGWIDRSGAPANTKWGA